MIQNSYFHGPSGDLLAVDQGESVWAFSDLSGTTRSLGIHRADPAPDGHWDVAHRQYDDFGEQRPFAQSADDDLIDESGNGISANPDKTLIGNDVNLFESVPEFFQGSQWDAQAELYTLGGSYYDPFTGRYVQDTGGENGYVFASNSPNRDRVSLPTNFDFTSQDYANIYGTGISGTFNYLVGEGFRATLGDDYLAQAENYELVTILTAGATAGVVAGVGATTAAAAYGLGVFSTALLVGAASGGAEYLGFTATAAVFGGNGPTAGGLAASTLGGAAGGGLLHGAGLLATPVARAGLSGARTAVTTASNFVYDTGVPFARGFGRALANGPLNSAIDPSSAAFAALGRGVKGGLREVREGVAQNFPTRPGGTGAAYNELTGQGVYILRDSSGKVRYVGRGDAPERLIAHSKIGSGKDDLVGEILFNNNLPAAQAKSLEQELIQVLGGPQSVNPSTPLRNKIQGIGESNRYFVDLEFAADDNLVMEALRRARLLEL